MTSQWWTWWKPLSRPPLLLSNLCHSCQKCCAPPHSAKGAAKDLSMNCMSTNDRGHAALVSLARPTQNRTFLLAHSLGQPKKTLTSVSQSCLPPRLLVSVYTHLFNPANERISRYLEFPDHVGIRAWVCFFLRVPYGLNFYPPFLFVPV